MSAAEVMDIGPEPDEAEAAEATVVRAELMRVPINLSDALTLTRDPGDMLAEASKAAKALMQVMASKPDKVMMNGQQYIENEDWQTIGHFYGATAQIESDHFVEFGDVKGWEAVAILVSRDGRTLGRATAMCLNDEEKWCSRAKYEWHYVMKNGAILNEEDARKAGNSAMVWEDSGGKSRPKKQKVEVGVVAVPMFQLRSMAQTRASSKVHRTVLAFVPVLAGFSPTPAEELPDAVRVSNAPASKPYLEAPARTEKREKPSVPNGGEIGTPHIEEPNTDSSAGRSDDGPDLGVDVVLPEGSDLIVRCEKRAGNIEVTTAAGNAHLVYKQQLQALAEQVCQNREPVMLDLKRSASGNYYVNGITKVASINATKWTGGNCPTCLSDPCQCGKAF